jgi:digeranylgeranylglycerophospholipid reductase
VLNGAGVLKRSYDVVVVGAGPAGSSAALSAASLGMRVLVVERKSQVGVPVRCAEFIPAPLVGELALGREFVVQRIKGMKTFLPDGSEKTTLTPGLMIRRDLFDQTLCQAARRAGAELWLGTSAVGWDGEAVSLRKKGGDRLKVGVRVVIGADGPHSTVGRWIGSVNTHLVAAVQVRVPLVRPLEYTEVYFEKNFYGGYGWLFPKGGEANVGMGIRKEETNPRILSETLRGFMDRLTRENKIRNQPCAWTAGWVPAEAPRSIMKDLFLLAGDAAGQTHPITGAGVFQAVTAGRMAGECAAKAVREKDLSLLTGYEEEWKDFYAEIHERGLRKRQLLEREWGHLDQVIRRCWVAFREYYE